MKAIAPGKLIYSGEHAVVHGKPALVLAVDRHVHAEIQAVDEDVIRVSFPGVLGDDEIPTAALPGLKKRLLDNYNRFLTGTLGIRHVLGNPAELIYYAIVHLLDETEQTLRGGLRITLTTDLPIGCGMGSSAAVVASVIGGVAGLFNVNTPRDTLYRWTLETEKLQHGHPSGVDPFITVHGGFVRFQRGEARALTPPRKPLQLALTGAPESTTGECVARVTQSFPMTDPIWPQFERVTDELARALREGKRDDIRAAVRANHRLLVRIGVVPARIQRFIDKVEAAGDAAKICGAGAVTGDAAGVILIIGDADISGICEQYEYDTFPVRADTQGLTFKSA